MTERILLSHLPHIQAALGEEIREAKRQKGERVRLSHGRAEGESQHGWLYRFRADQEVRVPDGCGIHLEAAGRRVAGSVITVEGFEVLIELDDRLTPVPRHALMFIELWFILERLGDRLQALGALEEQRGPGRPLQAMEVPGAVNRPQHPMQRPFCNHQQSLAIEQSLTNPATFIWGPPGTGKTSTIGRLVFEAIQGGLRVLLLAYSNAAVDVAMTAIARQFHARGPEQLGQVLRLGTPRNREVAEHAWLTTEAVLRQTQPGLIARRDRLRDQLRSRGHRSGSREYEELRRELAAIREQVSERELELASGAQVLGATLARLAINRFFASFETDLVVLDEASMTSIPFALLAGATATRHFVVAGDFRQLPPVVLSKNESARRWLERHAFDHAGITRAVERDVQDPRLVMLQTQYRMHSRISEVVSGVFYDGRLQDDEETEAKTGLIAARVPQPGQATVLIDTGRLKPWCQYEPRHLGRSRFNLVHALVVVLLVAAGMKKHSSVAVITPYRAQARLLRLFVDDLGWNDRVQVSTVHRFQGGEAEMVVLDLVAATPAADLGHLLGGARGSLAARLLNVAISRAKGKLVVVADRSRLLASANSEDAVRRVLTRLSNPGGNPTITIESLGRQLDQLETTRKVQVTGGQPLFGEPLTLAARKAREVRVALRSPVSVPVWLRDAAHRGVQVHVRGTGLDRSWMSLPNSRIDDYPSKFDACLVDRQDLVVSLPIAPWIVRVRTPETAAYLGDLLGLVPEDERSLPVRDPEMGKRGPLPPCPVCGGPVWLFDGRYGQELRCVNDDCRAVRRWTKETVTAYIRFLNVICPACGSLPEVTNGLFVRCSRSGCEWREPYDRWL